MDPEQSFKLTSSQAFNACGQPGIASSLSDARVSDGCHADGETEQTFELRAYAAGQRDGYTDGVLRGLKLAATYLVDYSDGVRRPDATTGYNAIVRAIRARLCGTCDVLGQVVDPDSLRRVACPHPGLVSDWQELPR